MVFWHDCENIFARVSAREIVIQIWSVIDWAINKEVEILYNFHISVFLQ